MTRDSAAQSRFPLTPTLSPEERGPRWPPVEMPERRRPRRLKPQATPESRLALSGY
jgi:hypothetical protein